MVVSTVIGFCTGLLCGARIGAAVGNIVGFGDTVGLIVTDVGFGESDGVDDGWLVGEILGFVDGEPLSIVTGFGDGGTVGSFVGESDEGGSVVGSFVAATGRPVGAAIGRMVGRNMGALVVGRDTGVGVTSVGVACGTESTGRYFMKRISSMRNVYIVDETFDLIYKNKIKRTIGPNCCQKEQCLCQSNSPFY